jgi:hypothetical protein
MANNYNPLVKKDNEVALFKHDLKFMDFHNVTFRYLLTTPLKGEKRTSLAVRIHDYVFPMQQAISHYEFKKKKQAPETYHTIESGLKETLRRAKISIALNNNQNKLFIGYWKYLVGVLREDSHLLKDTELENCVSQFEKNVSTMKA